MNAPWSVPHQSNRSLLLLLAAVVVIAAAVVFLAIHPVSALPSSNGMSAEQPASAYPNGPIPQVEPAPVPAEHQLGQPSLESPLPFPAAAGPLPIQQPIPTPPAG